MTTGSGCFSDIHGLIYLRFLVYDKCPILNTFTQINLADNYSAHCQQQEMIVFACFIFECTPPRILNRSIYPGESLEIDNQLLPKV